MIQGGDQPEEPEGQQIPHIRPVSPLPGLEEMDKDKSFDHNQLYKSDNHKGLAKQGTLMASNPTLLTPSQTEALLECDNGRFWEQLQRD